MSNIAIFATTSLIVVVAGFLNVAEAKKADKVSQATVDCNLPTASLQDAIDAAVNPTVITFTGVCVGDLTVRVDDLTLQGQTVNDAIDGTILVDAARRIMLQNFTLQASVSGNTGVEAAAGASVRITGLTIDGHSTSGNAAQGVAAYNAAVVRLFGTTVKNVDTGVLSFGGSVVELRNSSLIDHFGSIGVQADQGSSARILGSTVTMRNSGNIGALVGRRSVMTIQDSTISAADSTENTTSHSVQVQEDSFARIENSTVVANNSDTNSSVSAIAVLESKVRLRGDGNAISNIGGGFALTVLHGGEVTQSGGHSAVTGRVEIGESSAAVLQNVTITGNVLVFEDSLLRLRNLSGNNSQDSVDGSVELMRDSALTSTDFGGGLNVNITGNLTCDDAESRWGQSGTPLQVSGTFSCTGF